MNERERRSTMVADSAGALTLDHDNRSAGIPSRVPNPDPTNVSGLWRRYIPVVVLAALAPAVAEVLFGATPVTRFGSLPLIIALYGGGAVLIRELVRRRDRGWRAGWVRIALLGSAFAIVEEGLALQSMFNPGLFDAGAVGGRALGVNWVWTEWTVGYHIVWSIALPILLVELLFPARRAAPWLGRRGVTVAAGIYALAAVALAAIFWLAVEPEFRAPLHVTAAALLVIGLAALALSRPVRSVTHATARKPTRKAPSLWLVMLAPLLAAGAWFGLLDLPQGLRTGPVVLIPMLAAVTVAAVAVALVRHWSAPDRQWTDLHRLALVPGPLLVSWMVGFLSVTAGNPVDRTGQAVVGAVAAVLLAVFARRLSTRTGVMSEVAAVRCSP